MSAAGIIVGLRARPVTLALRATFATSLRATAAAETVVVEVLVDDATFGVGEATPVAPITGETVASVTDTLLGPVTAALVGRSADDLDGALAAVAAATPSQPAPRAAADLALHDLVATRRGVSLPRLIGSGGGAVATDVTVSLAAPDAMAKAAATAAGEGFATLKLKLGHHGAGPAGVAADRDRVLAVRDAVGPGVRLRVDGNQAWSPKEAVALARGIEADGIPLDLLEQPVAAGDLAGLAEVRSRVGVPVAADEAVWGVADVRAVAAAAAADVVNIKILKAGGLAPALAAARAATEAGLGWMVGCMMEGPGGLAAAVALAGCGPAAVVHDLDAGWWLAEPDGRLRYRAGTVTAHDTRPGQEG